MPNTADFVFYKILEEGKKIRMKLSGKWKVVVALFLVAVMITGMQADVNADTNTSSTITSESIQEKESQITEMKSQKEELESSLTDIQELKEQLEDEKSDLESYVETLDSSLTSMQEKIDELKDTIEEKESDITTTEEELDAALEQQEEQYEAMKERIKFMYEQGENYYIEMLLESASYGDMLNKVDYIQELSDYDDTKLQEYALTTQYIETCKEELEAEKELLEQAKASEEEEESALQELISDKETEITDYTNNISDKETAIQEYEDEIAAQDETISALEKAVEEEKKKLEEQNQQTITYDGGMFCWPAPEYTRISDDYGYRIHPILGVEQFHNGVDMAAPSGSPILAAYDGEVVAASYSSTMGNYIMIDHGDGLYTIYMHASALYVSTGQTVSKGEQIAAVGSTGRSTGAHLHFGVRLNGSYVSPWNYLSQ